MEEDKCEFEKKVYKKAEWTNSSTVSLLKLVLDSREFVKGKLSMNLCNTDKANVWKNISKSLEAEGYNFTENQCSTKYNGLCNRKAEKIRDYLAKKNQSGGPTPEPLDEVCNLILKIRGEKSKLFEALREKKPLKKGSLSSLKRKMTPGAESCSTSNATPTPGPSCSTSSAPPTLEQASCSNPSAPSTPPEEHILLQELSDNEDLLPQEAVKILPSVSAAPIESEPKKQKKRRSRAQLSYELLQLEVENSKLKGECFTLMRDLLKQQLNGNLPIVNLPQALSFVDSAGVELNVPIVKYQQ